jgi:hypothetical protein
LFFFLFFCVFEIFVLFDCSLFLSTSTLLASPRSVSPVASPPPLPKDLPKEVQLRAWYVLAHEVEQLNDGFVYKLFFVILFD